MAVITIIPASRAISEGTSGRVRARLKDEDGAAIDTSGVTATVATYHDHRGVVINSRSAQDVFSANGGSWATGGWFTMQLTPADTQVSAGPEFQLRKLGLLVTHSLGKKAPQEIWFYVRRLSTI